jgi:hypothetical protein
VDYQELVQFQVQAYRRDKWPRRVDVYVEGVDIDSKAAQMTDIDSRYSIE